MLGDVVFTEEPTRSSPSMVLLHGVQDSHWLYELSKGGCLCVTYVCGT